MTWWAPVLYFGENSSANSNESSGSDGTSSSQDWQFCVVYEGLDTYNVHGHRNSTGQNWDITFLSRQSLAQFLLSTISRTSLVTTTLYAVDEDSLWRDNFQNYYQSWSQNNELYSHQSLWSDIGYQEVMDHLLLLRDARVN